MYKINKQKGKDMYKIYDLDREEFPMLFSLLTLNDTLSCEGQSAPGCAAEWPKEKWQVVENRLAMLPAKQFVSMGLANNEWPSAFTEFERTWE
jgi:hypothetical protein